MNTAIDLEISQIKQQITATQPPGVRLELCKSAITRAKTRAVRAEEILKLAGENKMQADKDLEEKERDRRQIEAELKAGATPVSDSNCLASLQEGMRRVVGEMETGGQVPAEMVGQARAQMQALFMQLSTLAQQCQAQAAAHQPAAQHLAQPAYILQQQPPAPAAAYPQVWCTHPQQQQQMAVGAAPVLAGVQPVFADAPIPETPVKPVHMMMTPIAPNSPVCVPSVL